MLLLVARDSVLLNNGDRRRKNASVILFNKSNYFTVFSWYFCGSDFSDPSFYSVKTLLNGKYCEIDDLNLQIGGLQSELVSNY